MSSETRMSAGSVEDALTEGQADKVALEGRRSTRGVRATTMLQSRCSTDTRSLCPAVAAESIVQSL